MCRLIESIKVENGVLCNISFHNDRMKRSVSKVFGLSFIADLEKLIRIPADAQKGIYKCRVGYDTDIKKIEFLPYSVRPVSSLNIVFDDNISYDFKYSDRESINDLMEKRGNCDDIIIIKNGFVTDSSYANIVFRDISGNWITPSTYLLPGTRRAYLLQNGLIKEEKISYRDISNYNEVKLINAMLGLDDSPGISVKKIFQD